MGVAVELMGGGASKCATQAGDSEDGGANNSSTVSSRRPDLEEGLRPVMYADRHVQEQRDENGDK